MYQLPTAPRANRRGARFRLQACAHGLRADASLRNPDEPSGCCAVRRICSSPRRACSADPAAVIHFFFSWRSWLLGFVMIALGMFIYGASIVRVESIAQRRRCRYRCVVPGDLAASSWHSIGACSASSGDPSSAARLFIIPGIYLIGSLFLFVPAIVLDRKGPVESLGHSHRLVMGNWWRMATIGGIAFIILYLVYVVAAVVVGFVMGFRGTDPAFVSSSTWSRRSSAASWCFRSFRRSLSRCTAK